MKLKQQEIKGGKKMMDSNSLALFSGGNSKQEIKMMQQERLRKMLLRLAEKTGDDYVIRRKVTHRELAQLLGTSRETVTRAFDELEKKNYIEVEDESREIVLKDISIF